MGQKLSISQEEENELHNLFQIDRPSAAQETPKSNPIVMMRLMAPTPLTPQPRVMRPSSPVRKQRVRQPAAKARRAPKRKQ